MVATDVQLFISVTRVVLAALLVVGSGVAAYRLAMRDSEHWGWFVLFALIGCAYLFEGQA